MSNNNTYGVNHTNGDSSLTGLVTKLQAEDSRNLQMYKRFQSIYMVFIFFYAFVFILNPFWHMDLLDRLGGLCYVLAFLILFLVFRKYNRAFREIDYSDATAEMLRKAAKRYSFGNTSRILVTIMPLLLVDAAISITIYKRYTDKDPWLAVYIVQGVYFAVILISFFIGYMMWYNRQKPLRDEALRLLSELEQ
jgi:hypothetical protein